MQLMKLIRGTVLYVDVVRPADSAGHALPGRYPVLLTQTPYNKNGALSFEDDYLVEHGYVQVIADVRGTGSSEGTWASFGPREQRDGYELAEWARNQSWSNHSIGLHGTSYGAINQFLTAEQQPPGVKAAFPIVPMSDAQPSASMRLPTLEASYSVRRSSGVPFSIHSQRAAPSPSYGMPTAGPPVLRLRSGAAAARCRRR